MGIKRAVVIVLYTTMIGIYETINIGECFMTLRLTFLGKTSSSYFYVTLR